MAGIKIKSALKPGEKITGVVKSVHETTVVLELENEDRIKQPFPVDVLDTLNEDFDGDLVTVSRDGDEYDIVEHDDWEDVSKDEPVKDDKKKK